MAVISGDEVKEPFDVHIDVERRDGHLRIGECHLEDETEQEVLINPYTCHPLGANDDLSGIVCAVELFKRLSGLESRRYGYRLCLWLETIGPITCMAHNDRRDVSCGMTLGICGDGSRLKFDCSIEEDGPMDDALFHLHVMSREYSGSMGATDSRHFNGMGSNVPMVTSTRGGPVVLRRQ